jgi:hypothetical protein
MNLGNRYLWRPDPDGPFCIRVTLRLPGHARPYRLVKSLGTQYLPEARRIRDSVYMPIMTSLRCARSAEEVVRSVASAAQSTIERDLMMAYEGLLAARFGGVPGRQFPGQVAAFNPVAAVPAQLPALALRISIADAAAGPYDRRARSRRRAHTREACRASHPAHQSSSVTRHQGADSEGTARWDAASESSWPTIRSRYAMR